MRLTQGYGWNCSAWASGNSNRIVGIVILIFITELLTEEHWLLFQVLPSFLLFYIPLQVQFSLEVRPQLQRRDTTVNIKSAYFCGDTSVFIFRVFVSSSRLVGLGEMAQ